MVNSENENDSFKSKRILMAVALFMMAIVIGYNAFFVGRPADLLESIPNSPSESISNNEPFSKLNRQKLKESEDKNMVININTASEEELTKLKKIGPSKAKNIIKYRETHGGFSSVEEIMNVKGIGKKIFDEIKNSIKV